MRYSIPDAFIHPQNRHHVGGNRNRMLHSFIFGAEMSLLGIRGLAVEQKTSESPSSASDKQTVEDAPHAKPAPATGISAEILARWLA
jgi:hypothetical protein